MVGVMAVTATYFKRPDTSMPHAAPSTAVVSAPDPYLRDSHRILAQFLEGSLLLSPGSWCAQSFVVPPRVCFPSPVKVL